MSKRKNTDSVNWAELRQKSGLTLTELAAKSGYSVATINGLELKDEGSKRLREKLFEIFSQQNPYILLRAASAYAVREGGTPAEQQAIFERTVEDTTRWMKRAMDGAEKLRAAAKRLREEASLLEKQADEMHP